MEDSKGDSDESTSKDEITSDFVKKDSEGNWVEVFKIEAGFKLENFWKIMEQYCFTPHYVYKRIAFAEVTKISDPSHESIDVDDNHIIRYSRILHSKVPKYEKPLKDEVTFNYKAQDVTFCPLFPSHITEEEQYIPYFYPKVRCFRYSYVTNSEDVNENQLVATAKLFSDSYKSMMETIARSHFTIFIKRCKRDEGTLIDPNQQPKKPKGKNNKRKKEQHHEDHATSSKDTVDTSHNTRISVHHDTIVDQQVFYAKYHQLKEKYKFWVKEWPESTDPAKFVFEEVAIAAFLICLFEKERKELGIEELQTFADVGCGNGFLTYLLTNDMKDVVSIL